MALSSLISWGIHVEHRMTIGSSLTNTNPKNLRVFIVRHGQTAHNVQKILQGHKDIDMNETGFDQAAKVGERFKSVPVDGITTSDLVRCRNTTSEILKFHPGLSASLRVSEDWRERNMGPVEGMFLSDAMAKYGEDFRNMGEKHPQLISRVERQWEQVIQHGTENDFLNYIVCTHGGVISAYVNHLHKTGYKLSPQLTAENLRVPFNTSVTVIDVDKKSGEGTIQLFGDTAHLGEQLLVKDTNVR